MSAPRRLSILLVGDYPDDPTLGSPKVLFKLQAEFRALGHRCEIVFDRRHRRTAHSPGPPAGVALAGRPGDRSVGWSASDIDVVDAASAEGLWLGVLKKFGALSANAVRLPLERPRAPELPRACSTTTTPGSSGSRGRAASGIPRRRLSQVAAAARLADRLILLNEGDREFALDRGWQPPDRVDVVPHGVSQEFLDDDPGPRRAARPAACCSAARGITIKGITYLVARVRSGSTRRGTDFGLTRSRSRRAGERRCCRHSPSGSRQFVTVVARAPEAAGHRDVSTPRSSDLAVDVRRIRSRAPRSDEPAAAGRRDAGRLRRARSCATARPGIIVPPRDPGAIAAATRQPAGGRRRCVRRWATPARSGRRGHDLARHRPAHARRVPARSRGAARGVTRALSIGITTKDRPASLRACLESLALLDHLDAGGSRCSTIGSTVPAERQLDGLADRVRVLVGSARSPGHIVGRNRLVAAADAELVLLLDDDARLLTAEAVERAIQIVAPDPRVGADRVRAGRSGRPSVAGGDAAVAARRATSWCRASSALPICSGDDVSQEIGGYRESFGFYGEEKDFCLRLLDAGYLTVYLPDALRRARTG